MPTRSPLDRLRAVLAGRVPGTRGEWELGEHMRFTGAFRDAAVLVLLRGGAAGPEVLLTRRPSTLRLHPGEVALPGGGREPGDADMTAAALREAWEEVGIPPQAVEVLGSLDVFEGATGHRLHTTVGVLTGDVPLRLGENEVEEAAWVPVLPLAPLAGRKTLIWKGREATTHRFPLDRLAPEVWGLTAGVLVLLLELLNPPQDP